MSPQLISAIERMIDRSGPLFLLSLGAVVAGAAALVGS
jgi:hypothetical protein